MGGFTVFLHCIPLNRVSVSADIEPWPWNPAVVDARDTVNSFRSRILDFGEMRFVEHESN